MYSFIACLGLQGSTALQTCFSSHLGVSLHTAAASQHSSMTVFLIAMYRLCLFIVTRCFCIDCAVMEGANNSFGDFIGRHLVPVTLVRVHLKSLGLSALLRSVKYLLLLWFCHPLRLGNHCRIEDFQSLPCHDLCQLSSLNHRYLVVRIVAAGAPPNHLTAS